MTPEARTQLLEELARVVAEMRRAQNRFFKGGKTRTALDESRALEARVDRIVAQLQVAAPGDPTQGRLL